MPLRPTPFLLPAALLLALAMPSIAQVDETVVLTLPAGGVTALVAGSSTQAPTDFLMAVEPGIAVTCQMFARPAAGPGAYAPSQLFTGSAAALSDNSPYLMVGDPTDGGGGGAPRVHCWVDTGPSVLGHFSPTAAPVLLHPTDPSPTTEFGASVAVHGEIAVVGSPGSDEAFVYRDSNPPLGQWVLETTWTGQPGDRTGASVAADDRGGFREQVLIGSPLADDFAADGGRADFLVYDAGGGTWVFVAGYFSLWANAGYGTSVDIDRDAAIVGSPTSPFGGGGGMVDTYRWNGGWFDWDGALIGGGGGGGGMRFGEQVGIVGDTAVAWAPLYDGFTAGLPDPAPIPDRGGAVLLKDNGFDYVPPSGDFFYTLSDLGNGVPFDFGPMSLPYDGYDRLVYVYADDGVSGHVLEYVLSTVSWVWANEGFALGGVSGEPALRAEGSLWPLEPVRVTVMNTVPNGLGYLMYGLAAIHAPFKGGVVVPQFYPPFGNAFPWPLSPLGDATLTVPMPPSIAVSGLDLYLQVWILDPAGPAGWAASNAVKGTFP
jgi:hypothetical protein